MSIQFRILLSRFLTRFGDQAWEFAVPLVLIELFPGKLNIVALYYLSIKVFQMFFLPYVMKVIDNWKRKNVFQLGIGSQTISLIISWLIIVFSYTALSAQNLTSWLILSALIFLGILSSLGSSLMDVSVGFDLAVDYIPENQLPIFNSRLKRLDLLTEVTAPLAAGLLLLAQLSDFKYLGFTFIALINFVSFAPEYILLNSVLKSKDLAHESKFIKSSNLNPFSMFASGFKYFKDSSYAIPMLAYSCLWLSVLSPHGVLLTGYLKDSLHVSETEIGIFRGLGALFGLIPTFLYVKLYEKWKLQKTAQRFLGFQVLCVLSALIFFLIGAKISLYLFLFFILLSRIGLYGFSIAESEARQKYIPAHLRGQINGFGVSLNSFATLLLFLLGTLLPESSDFKYLVYISVVFVVVGFLILRKWKIRT